jgi:glycosyltransferase involved in cell wall biosynthesis
MNSGFPFIKVRTIRDNSPGVDISDWRETLAAHGYDVSIAERTLAEAQPPLKTNDLSVPMGKWPLLSPAPDALDLEAGFDSEFYLAAYPDIAAAGVDPYDHYVKHGRAEGRLARTPALDALDHFGSLVGAPETVLVVSHEGVRGGAPILAYTLVKGLLEKYNVIVLFLSAGPMLEACRDAGAVVAGPIGLAGSMPLAELVVKRISDAAPIKFAIINTIASRYVLPALAKRYIPTVSLIHEFAAYIRPRNAFREAVLWSGEVVFSTEITRDNALTEYPELGGRAYPIIPQGLCIVPKDGPTDRDERAHIRRLLRPEGFPAEGLVIVGAGLVDYRKGVDLFIDCAARVVRCAPNLPCHFAWIGRGYDPEGDVAYSVYLADQIRRSGLNGHFVFLNEIYDFAAVYEIADLLLLSSRLDPLPNVAIDALTFGVPVICFANTTGIADILNTHGLGEHTVASYLDTDNMAQKVVSLAQSRELRARVAEQSSRIARTTFSAMSYRAQLEQTAAQQAVRSAQERIDVETIAKTDLPRLDFYLLPDQQKQPREEVIRGYVRSWASGIGRRKLFPGFHPGIYREQHGLQQPYADPLADYLRAGQPKGPWSFPLIGPEDQWKPIPSGIRIALHVHAYHLDVFPEILERLTQNSVRPDLLISVKSKNAQKKMQEQLETYKGGRVEIHLVPDPGRDLGPFLTEFGNIMLNEYDIIGHLHTKTSADLADSSAGKIWVRFMLENVLGGRSAPMADIILSRMAEDPNIGLVFADDPHVIGWDKNKRFVTRYCSAFSLETFPENLHFPVGAMFWARPMAIKSMFELGLDWQDYPVEPLPYDGSLLHGLERLFGLAASQAGFSIFNTNVHGVTR